MQNQIDTFVSCSLICHSGFAESSSYDSCEDFASCILVKYFPVTPSKSGEVATYRILLAALLGLMKNGRISMNPKVTRPLLLAKLVLTTPGCALFTVTLVPSSFFASS